MNKSLRHLSFDNVWKMRIDHPYSLIVKDGGLLWSCGQCPLGGAGEVLDPGDLGRQATTVAGFIRRYLSSIGSGVSEIGQLVVYYVKTKANDAQALIDLYKAEFGDGLLVTPVSVPFFYYEGMLIEVDVFGASSRKRHRRIVDPATGVDLELVDAGERVWAMFAARELPAGAAGLEASLRHLAEEASLPARNLLSSQWFVADGAALAWVDAAAATGWGRGGAVCIDFDGYRAFADLTFCKTPVSRRSFAIDGPSGDAGAVNIDLSRCGERFSIEGRDNGQSRSLVAQTESIMTAIDQVFRSASLDFADVRKSTTYYVAGGTAEDLHANMSVRNRYYAKPGPASTGLPVKGFQRSNALISIKLTG